MSDYKNKYFDSAYHGIMALNRFTKFRKKEIIMNNEYMNKNNRNLFYFQIKSMKSDLNPQMRILSGIK